MKEYEMAIYILRTFGKDAARHVKHIIKLMDERIITGDYKYWYKVLQIIEA